LATRALTGATGVATATARMLMISEKTIEQRRIFDI
jgi:hypothetical protein